MTDIASKYWVFVDRRIRYDEQLVSLCLSVRGSRRAICVGGWWGVAPPPLLLLLLTSTLRSRWRCRACAALQNRSRYSKALDHGYATRCPHPTPEWLGSTLGKSPQAPSSSSSSSPDPSSGALLVVRILYRVKHDG